MVAIEPNLRSRLGRVGVWMRLGNAPIEEARSAVVELEHLGYKSIWFGESPKSREVFAHAALLLGCSSRIVVGTGIANVWARDAVAMANGAATLGEAFAGRFMLGLGISHAPQVTLRGHRYVSPVEHMAEYLVRMDTAGYLPPMPEPRVPRVLAALRPRMLELAGRAADGAHPYLTTPDHTAMARSVLGEEKLLAPMQMVLMETQSSAAREVARENLAMYLALPNYAKSMLAQGFQEHDLLGGGSDRLVDALVAWGTESAIAERVGEHIGAGADHVLVQPIGGATPADTQMLAALAPWVTG